MYMYANDYDDDFDVDDNNNNNNNNNMNPCIIPFVALSRAYAHPPLTPHPSRGSRFRFRFRFFFLFFRVEDYKTSLPGVASTGSPPPRLARRLIICHADDSCVRFLIFVFVIAATIYVYTCVCACSRKPGDVRRS